MVSIEVVSPGHVRIEGECEAATVWSFLKSYGSVTNLSNRIGQLSLSDAAGQEIRVRRVAPGEYEAATPASRFRYEVDLTPPAIPGDAAFVSWLTPEHGLLVLGDLLPSVSKDISSSARNAMTLRFKLPPNWSVDSSERRNSSGDFEVSDPLRAVFAVGRLRAKEMQVRWKGSERIRLNLITDGAWAFADDEVLQLAGQILAVHAEVLGGSPGSLSTIILMQFPVAVSPEKWSAETRGSTVTLLLGKQPSKVVALAQLSTPLTHELFHLWVPNGLALDGDYSWFYEGFTNYQAARTAVRLQLLTFDDFLNGIGRAYDVYSAAPDRDQWSLVEASSRRWANGQPVIYQKGMLVAFLYDLELRSQSRGKRSLDDVYREVFRRYRDSFKPDRKPEGSRTAVAILGGFPGMNDFVERFIQRPAAISLDAELRQSGLRVERAGLRSFIRVNDSLSHNQRDLLKELGYNDRPFRHAQGRAN